jgi:hypothetical protein
VLLRPTLGPRSSRALSTNAQVLHPGPHPITGVHHHEASSRVHSRSPARSSPQPGVPWVEHGPLSTFPGLRTPQTRSLRRTPGGRQAIEHSPGVTRSALPTSYPYSSIDMCEVVSHPPRMVDIGQLVSTGIARVGDRGRQHDQLAGAAARPVGNVVGGVGVAGVGALAGSPNAVRARAGSPRSAGWFA